jgi:hypothetical protein
LPNEGTVDMDTSIRRLFQAIDKEELKDLLEKT